MRAQQQQGLAQAMDPTAAAAAGAAQVDGGEVRAALQHMASGRAPGPDGLPVELWRVGEGAWAPLLARLYTAMAEQQSLPCGFTLGRVAPIHKAGDAAMPGNYRPITLLNADYKLLARVLAGRFGEAMAGSIGPEQTAFLPGRQIGDGVALAQLLPVALSAAGARGAVVLLDIAKAYDTVDRAFLLQAMQAHGASEGMVRWVSLLLSDTRAAACVDGQESLPAVWHAGVRQGCPLSPLLYLFVAEALACWLRQAPQLGIDIGGTRYVSAHYADDAKVFLASLQQGLVDSLLQHLQVFAAASGQQVHAGKSQAVPLGALPAEEHGTTTAVPVQGTAGSLGVCVGPVGVQPLARQGRPGLRGQVREPELVPARVAPAWDQRVQAVTRMCNMVAGLPLSAMGRGLAVSGYALSRVLFSAEHEGLPQRVERQLQAAVARAVDRPGSRVPGVRGDFLHGSPRAGGFGVLPVGQHVVARHARMAYQLLAYLCGQPYQPVLSGNGGRGRSGAQQQQQQPPGPGLQSQQQPREQPEQEPQQQQQQQRVQAWVRLAHYVLGQVCPILHPAQVLLCAAFSTVTDVQQGRLTRVGSQRLLLPAGPLLRVAVAMQRLGPLHVHPQYAGPRPVDVARWVGDAGVPPAEVVQVVPALVWASQLGVELQRALGPCRPQSVRGLTVMQLAPQVEQRSLQHAAYAAQALHQSGLPRGAWGACAQAFVSTLRQVWRVPWENRHKEVLWRLAVNGVAGAGGCDVCFSTACACGFALTPAQCRARQGGLHRQHVFWDCPVALAVRAQLQRGLGVGVGQVAQHHVWLLQPPGEEIQRVVWQVVALAALGAMEAGRRYLWRCRHEGMEAVAALERARLQAVAAFWLSLHDFCGAGRPAPRRGWEGVGEHHPFLAVRRGAGATSLVVVAPAG